MFAWMPVARMGLSIRDCLCHDSLFVAAFWMLVKTAQLVTPAMLDLPGWLEMLSLVWHGLSGCVCVTIGGHKVSPISTCNYTVMQPHQSPESIEDLSPVAACLVYIANSAHFIHCGHFMAYDLWERSRFAEIAMEACERTLHYMMTFTMNLFLRMGEFLINPVYIPTTSKWIRTPTASNGKNSTSIRMSSTPSHYGSNPPALRSVATYLQRSRLPMKTRLPNMVSRNPRTKV